MRRPAVTTAIVCSAVAAARDVVLSQGSDHSDLTIAIAADDYDVSVADRAGHASRTGS